MLSQASNYAVKALIYIYCEGEKKSEDERFFRVRNISQKTKVPPYYLGKIMQKLVKKGIVNSVTGPRGGFSLNRAGSAISLFDIVLAVDGEEFIYTCFMGRDRCEDNVCPMHQTWGQAREKLIKKLKSVTLVQVIRQGNWKEICQ